MQKNLVLKKRIRIKQKSERNTSILFLIVLHLNLMLEYMHDFLFKLKANFTAFFLH